MIFGILNDRGMVGKTPLVAGHDRPSTQTGLPRLSDADV